MFINTYLTIKNYLLLTHPITNLELSIIFLILIFFISKNYMNNKENLSLKSMILKFQSSLSFNYNADIEFLNYLIGYKAKVLIERNLENRIDINNNNLINGKMLDETVSQIVIEVYTSISDTYKFILLKYFNESSLKVYITEVVMDIAITKSKSKNYPVLSKILNSSTQPIRQNDIDDEPTEQKNN